MQKQLGIIDGAHLIPPEQCLLQVLVAILRFHWNNENNIQNFNIKSSNNSTNDHVRIFNLRSCTQIWHKGSNQFSSSETSSCILSIASLV